MAIDIIQAEKGGVCEIFGTACCTYIPNNTAPDGSITRALERPSSNHHAENAGIDDPFSKMMEWRFRKWKALAIAVFTSVGVAATILLVCGCCCIPCL